MHRNRANLIQTVNTCSALLDCGVAVELQLPPWHGLDVRARLVDLGARADLNVRAYRLLHRRWAPRWFVLLHRRRLLGKALYTRNPELSLAMAKAGVGHSMEVHQVEALRDAGQLNSLIRFHREGVIRWLVPISSAAAQALGAAGAESSRIRVAPSGVAVEAYASVPPYAPPRGRLPNVLYVGRISHSRGLHVLEELARRGLIRLLLVGEQGSQVASHPAVEARPFVAPREVPGLYVGADLILLPYQRDLAHADAISPIKLFEAMAAGRPIVASDLPPLREIITDGETGLLVPPDDIDAWAHALKRLLDTPELVSTLVANARRKVDRYSWRNRARNIAELLGTPTKH